MFAWAAAGAASIGIDTDQERKPPSAPTPLEFPRCLGVKDNELQRVVDFSDIYKKLVNVKKPQDITIEHVKALNLKIESDIDSNRMFPDEDLRGHAPFAWESSDGEPKLMGSGYPYPSRSKYELVKKELMINNEDGYREVTRMPPLPGQERVRLTQSRKFWAGLERISQYWDTSLDEYFEKPITGTEDKDTGEIPSSSPVPQVPRACKEQIAQMTHGSEDSVNDGSRGFKKVYKGRRVGTGSEMPADIRDDTMRGFLEMVAWPFQCQASIPSQLPRLLVQNMLFPVRHTLVAGRVPEDRTIARGGILEGPLLGVQCREETTFRDHGDIPGYSRKEACDVFREIGAMLLLAQERSREGTVEVKPGEGKWWTTTPRWGGAPHNGITGEAANSEKADQKETDKQDIDENGVHKRIRYGHSFRQLRRPARARRLTASEKWNIIEPGPSLWDRKMKYMKVGKPKNSPYDDIYLISQINHHVSILHLRVHERYIDCLTKGTSNVSKDGDSKQPWNVLKLRRSKWYDLLDVEQRVEAFHTLWKLFHYLMRPEQPCP